MPTGYTYKIEEGGLTFNEFVLECAGAFFVECRDETDAQLKEFKPLSYHLGPLNEAKEELAEAHKLTLTDCTLFAKQEYKAELIDYNERMKHIETVLARYQAMLEKTHRWQPPTPEHEGLKRFMLEQLKESMEQTDTGEYMRLPTLQTGEGWKQTKINSIQSDIDYHTKQHAKETEVAVSNNDWMNQLRQSLEA